MWDHHLYHYQLLLLKKEDLRELGYLSDGKVKSYSNGKIELEIDLTQATGGHATRLKL